MFYGVVVAVVVVLVIALIIRSLCAPRRFTPLSYAIMVVLVPILSFHFSLLFGAFTVKGRVDDMESAASYALSATNMDSYEIVSKIKKKMPFVSYLVNLDDIEGDTAGEIAESLSEDAHSSLNWYIFRRILWSVVFSGLAVAGIIATMEGPVRSRRSWDGARPASRGGSGYRSRRSGRS